LRYSVSGIRDWHDTWGRCQSVLGIDIAVDAEEPGLGERVVDAELEYREFASARAAQLFRLAFLMSGNWHEAEDLVQSTLASLFVAWNRVSRCNSMEAYARRVLVNTFLSQRRLRRSRETPVAQFADASAPAVDQDLRLTLVAALRQLPPRSRAVVVLRYVEDHNIDSVAELLDITPAAVKSLTARALAQLREVLSGDEHLLQQ
jgi:RNA polymerase sigma-70 factor (sigma-E family)